MLLHSSDILTCINKLNDRHAVKLLISFSWIPCLSPRGLRQRPAQDSSRSRWSHWATFSLSCQQCLPWNKRKLQNLQNVCKTFVSVWYSCCHFPPSEKYQSKQFSRTPGSILVRWRMCQTCLWVRQMASVIDTDPFSFMKNSLVSSCSLSSNKNTLKSSYPNTWSMVSERGIYSAEIFVIENLGIM